MIPATRSVDRAIMEGLQEAYYFEASAQVYALSPFWLACAHVMPPFLDTATSWWGAEDDFSRDMLDLSDRFKARWGNVSVSSAELSPDNVAKGVEKILQFAVESLRSKDYRTHLGLIKAEGWSEKSPVECAEDLVVRLAERVYRDNFPVLIAPVIEKDLRTVVLNLGECKERLSTGDLAAYMQPASFGVIEKGHKALLLNQSSNLPDQLALQLVGKSLFFYLRTFYNNRYSRGEGF